MIDELEALYKERETVEQEMGRHPEVRGWRTHYLIVQAQIDYYMRANKAVMK